MLSGEKIKCAASKAISHLGKQRQMVETVVMNRGTRKVWVIERKIELMI